MEAQVTYNGKQVNLEYEILGPSIYVYKNAIPKEWEVIKRIEGALLQTLYAEVETIGARYSNCRRTAHFHFFDGIPNLPG